MENIDIKWDMNPNEILEYTNKIINQSRDITNKIVGINASKKNIGNLIELLSNDFNMLNKFHSICGFLQVVSPCENIKHASSKADLILSQYYSEYNLRKDVYVKLCDIKKRKLISDTNDVLFIDKLILNFKRNGIDLEDKVIKLLIGIKQEIMKLENETTGIANKYENTYINLRTKDLSGVPSNIIDTFEINGNNAKIQFNKFNYTLLMKYVDDSNTRKNIETSYSSKYGNLLDNMFKLIVLKDRYAKLLSYNCYSDYKAHIQMTKNSNNIKNFLTELLLKLDHRYKREMDTILKISKRDINSWDLQYYVNKWKKDYGIDEMYIREYFELNNTLSVILFMYEKMFGIKIKKIIVNSKLWSSKVDTYQIIKEDKVIGYFYSDLYARNGKYRQVQCFCLQPATLSQLPVTCIVASFNENVQGSKNTCLLTFQEVTSLFHEIAHILHHTFGKAKHSIFSGINVETDFIETPAQLLELLCWEKNIIKQLSRHYKNKNQLDDAIINKLVKLKNLDLALRYKKQIIMSLFDQIVYSSDDFVNTCNNILEKNDKNAQKTLIHNIYKQLYNEIMISNDNDLKYQIRLNENIGFPSEWASSIYEFDSQYYGSIWSKVLASDMYNEKISHRAKNNDLANIGDDIVGYMLKYGGTKPAYTMICDYIQRKPAIDGFINMHDLNIDVEYSFFLQSEQIKNIHSSSKCKTQVTDNIMTAYEHNKHNKQNYTETEYLDSASNKFSEINESEFNNMQF